MRQSGVGQRGLRILEKGGNRAQRRAGARREQYALLAHEPAQGVDARGPCRHPLRTNSMQRDQRLLDHAFHRHRWNLTGARRFEQRLRVGAVGFIPSHVGTHVRRRQQRDGGTVPLRAPPPIVGGATCFHHRVGRRRRRQESRELICRATMCHWRFAIATSNTVFATSTATVVASISVSSWLR